MYIVYTDSQASFVKKVKVWRKKGKQKTRSITGASLGPPPRKHSRPIRLIRLIHRRIMTKLLSYFHSLILISETHIWPRTVRLTHLVHRNYAVVTVTFPRKMAPSATVINSSLRKACATGRMPFFSCSLFFLFLIRTVPFKIIFLEQNRGLTNRRSETKQATEPNHTNQA